VALPASDHVVCVHRWEVLPRLKRCAFPVAPTQLTVFTSVCASESNTLPDTTRITKRHSPPERRCADTEQRATAPSVPSYHGRHHRTKHMLRRSCRCWRDAERVLRRYFPSRTSREYSLFANGYHTGDWPNVMELGNICPIHVHTPAIRESCRANHKQYHTALDTTRS
jgi:hypothetical protein